MSKKTEACAVDSRTKANAIRALSMDAVQKAASGHPGMPMGMADIAELLWSEYLKHNPGNPHWLDRDRFVVSNGHGSMLLYSLLHLSGYELSLDEIKNFRQLHSRTPGHPEYAQTPGVETTTGPLGQGIANAVGMAISERSLAARFNRPGFDIVDHHTYVFTGDGCLMEGISHEVCSLAGTLGLGKLIVFWDDNGISIDGEVKNWFADDTASRFRAYGWQVIEAVDGHDRESLNRALQQARMETDRPSILCCRTQIGYGSPNKGGKASSHGAPLGEDEIRLTRAQLNWPYDSFEIPENIYRAWDARERGAKQEAAWQERFARYRTEHADLATEFTRRMDGELPASLASAFASFTARIEDQKPNNASRKSSQNVIENLAPELPELLGGSADLTGSNLTAWSGTKAISANQPDGNYIYYGVREFGMSAIMNGIALHGGFIPYGGTFLMFSEYARNAVRMAALMKQRVLFVYTHDSIGLGEDGPTHQAVEQTASLRLVPNLDVWRPGDEMESAHAWYQALQRKDGPSCLLFSRQTLPCQSRNGKQRAEISRGAYILQAEENEASVVLIATGSELAIAVDAADFLRQQGIMARVISMPCTAVFDRQDRNYQQQVLGEGIPRVALEAGSRDGWYKYVGLQGLVIGLDSFGESAPGDVLYRHYGLTAEQVAGRVADHLATMS